LSVVPEKTLPLTQHPGLRQLVKFAIVGASSTVINLAVLYLMLRLLHGHRYISTSIAFLVSVVNGYYWNRRWTFKAAQAKAVHTQFAQFALVNLVGYGLDLLVMYLASVPLEHQVHLLEPIWSAAKTERVAVLAAQLIATAVIVFWNFFANRFWTFKH
jgi:putative flippase GtrA